MRIVDRKTFLSLPANTVYSKYIPCSFGELKIKGETWECDFLTQEIASAIEFHDSNQFHDDLWRAKVTGESLKMDFDCEGRDGMFEEDQLFAVWERPDVEALIERLRQCS